ncbi:hypothetical protein EDC56_2013 [Sinobacterium caligoides]|uniref:Uncharacterized protein n=1 Tax=Sinobacterium caligoides TaxID=933926 RepID=A0A3N2DP33_9GAMM|nr:hypothetical protein EDC56_2013 [Sinobacterium caligoides]
MKDQQGSIIINIFAALFVISLSTVWGLAFL